jgi:hypothetical protein
MSIILKSATSSNLANVSAAGALQVDASATTQPVSISGTIPVSGSVAVSNLPTTQPVSGTVAVSSLPALPAGANTVGAVNIAAAQTIAVTQAIAANLNATVELQDGTGAAINSISAGTGANGLLTAIGATNFTISSVNSTTVQLAPNATFTGTIENIISAPYLSLIMVSDQPGILTINQYITSSAGTLCSTVPFIIAAGVGFARSFALNGNFLSVTFKNTGASTTTTLNVNTAYGVISPTTQLLNIPVAVNEIGVASTTASAPAQQTVGTSSVSVLASNTARKQCQIVNTGTAVVYLGLGQTPTSTAYHVALSGCTTANDGTGGTYLTDLWKGAVNAIGITSSGTIVVTELT